MPFVNLSKLSPNQIAAVKAARQGARRAVNVASRERSVQAYPYYSTVVFSFKRGTPTGTLYPFTTSAAPRRAFTYAIGDDLQQAGAPTSGTTATPCETNLVNRGQTLAGELVKVYGISAYLGATSDPICAARVFEACSVAISLNGDQQTYRLGRMGFLPGAGGLFGGNITEAVTPAVNGGPAFAGGIANGNPVSGSFYRLPAPIWWQSAGNADSTLAIVVNVDRPEFLDLSVNGREAATGVEAWTPPENFFVSVTFRLHTISKSARSVNA